MIITIDGPSGTGKSTVARTLAENLGFLHFDTGAMYRSITWFFLEKKVNLDQLEEVEKILADFRFEIRTIQGEKKYFVCDEDVSKAIRSVEVTSFVSQVSALKCVREKLVEIQRAFSEGKNAVFEGRDMGSVVFPKAELKIFLTARSEVRAKRRFLELLQKFPEKKDSLSEKEIQKDIEARDAYDSTREISPLKQTKGMILVDTSDKTIEEVIAEIKKHYLKLSRKMHFFYRTIVLLVKGFFKIFYRLKIYGFEHFTEGAALIAANHTSYYDPPVVGISSPEEIHFLARDSLFKYPIFGALIRKLNSHPVAKGAQDAVVMKEILKLLKSGHKVLLFPEGARSYENVLGPMQPGIAFLVYKSRCKVIPTYIHGAYKVWNRRKVFPRPFGKIACVFGTPLSFDDLKDADRKTFMDAVMVRCENSFHELRKWYENGAKGTPP